MNIKEAKISKTSLLYSHNGLCRNRPLIHCYMSVQNCRYSYTKAKIEIYSNC